MVSKLIPHFLLFLLSASCCAQSMPAGGGMVFPRSLPIPSIVQSQSTGTVENTLVVTNPITAGNVLVAVIYGSVGHTLAFTDTLCNTSAMIASSYLPVDQDGIAVACAPITTGGSDVMTFTDNGVQTDVQAIVYEAHIATCTLDVTAVSHTATGSTSCNSGAMTTTTPNDLLIAVCGTDATNTATITAGSGWLGGLNSQLNSPTRPNVMSEYQIGTSPGTFTATSGSFSAAEEQATLLVALKP